MIDVEPLIRTELERWVPVPQRLGDWTDVRRRAGLTRRRRRVAAALAATAGTTLLLVAATPLGGAVVRSAGAFSDWLAGEPGTPAAESEQRRFERGGAGSWAAWPERPELRELLRARVGVGHYVLYGFRTGEMVCLRLGVSGIAGTGPVLGCVPLAQLERSRDLLIPVKGNVGFGHVGPLPRKAGDPPTVARALATFGFAGAGVVRLEAHSDARVRPGVVANGAFLAVVEPRRGEWLRRVVARDAQGREWSVPIAVEASGQRPLATGLRAHGPARVARVVRGGTIEWFVRRERRGTAVDAALLPRFSSCCAVGAFARAIAPVAGDFLRMVVAEGRRAGEICHFLATRGGIGGGCTPSARLFARGPLALSWGFSGAGQQFWIVSGLVSDEVARLDVFLGTGERRPVPLRDNVVIERVQRTKFPARLVAYDREGRVIGVVTIWGG